MPGTAGAPSRMAMPGCDWRLSDANVADVLSFVRSNWGNRAEAVLPAEVATVRNTLGNLEAKRTLKQSAAFTLGA